MTVRHRQRKGAKSGFFLYAREKAFSKPPAFSAETARRFPAHGQITLHAPPAFSASFRPSTAPLPAFFAAKRGFFAPSAARFLPGARPDGDPACPGFARDPGARAHPWDPGSPRVCGFFARPHPLLPAVRRPNARRLPRPPPKPPRRAPPARPLPPPAARRSARRPTEAQPWGWQSRLPRSAFPLRREEVCDPRGRSDPWA